MSTIAGEVSTLQGVVRAVNPETGEARVLEKGSPVYAREVIETSPIGGVLINMQDGAQLTLGRDTQMRIDGDVADNAALLDAETEGAVDVAALQQAILEGNFDALEATAAGEEGTLSSASEGGVAVDRVGAQGEVTAGFETSTEARSFAAVREFTTVDEAVVASAPTLNTNLTLDDVRVDEGTGTATISATLSAAPTDAPLVMVLDNGATITFEVGETIATSTPFDIQGDDVYVDGQSITVSASVQSGGEQFASINSTDTATVTVRDTIDTTTVSLSATESTGEDGGSITYTATLTEIANNDVTVTLNNGETITIEAGDLAGKVKVDVNQDDVYLEEDSISAAITGVSEANAGTVAALENLTFDATPAVTTITDDKDAVTVSLSATESTGEDGGSITYTATLTEIANNDVTVTLNNGETITIEAGDLAGKVKVDVNQDDVYLEEDSISAAITGVSEANAGTVAALENLTFDATPAVTTITDDKDAVTISLGATPNVLEGGVITYTATVNHAPESTPLVISLDNDLTITIPVGELTGFVNVTVPDNISKDADSSIVVAIKSATGGNYEDVDRTATVTTIITDNDYNPDAEDDVFSATEVGSEFIASEDSVDTIGSVDDGVVATGNVLTNDETNNGNAVVTSIVIGSTTYAISSDGSDTTITTDYGNLVISKDGQFTFSVNDSNSDVQALNIGDSLPVAFEYTLSDGVNPDASAALTINIEGRDDAPVIESVTANNQSVHVVTGLLDANADGIADTINPEDLTVKDKGLIFSSNNGNLQIDLGHTPSNVAVEFNGGQAGYKNAVGYYTHDEEGALVAKIIYVDNSSFVGTENVDAGTLNDLKGEVGFFIIPNGGNHRITTDSIITMDSNGKMSADGKSVTAYYTDNNLNADGHDHVIAGPAEDGSGLVIGFEDLALGDRDYDDFVMTVKLCSTLGTATETILLTEDFEGITQAAGDTSGKDWYIDHGTDGDNILISDSQVVWTMNDAGIEVRTDDGVHGLDTANDSGHYVELDPHFANGLDTILSTNVDLGSNDAFTLTFDMIPRPGAADSSDMIFSFGGNQVAINVDSRGNLSFDPAGNVSANATANGWTTITATFENLATPATLSFAGGGDTDTLGAYIDNIKLVGIDSGSANTILSDINLSDVDDANLEGATVTLTNYQAGDAISADSLPAGITAQIVDGVVELTGSASVAAYEQALESLTFESTSEDRAPREFEFTVFDGDKHSNAMNVTVDIGGCSLNTSVADAPFVSIAVGDAIASGTAYDAYAYNGDNFMTGNGKSLGSLKFDSNETAIFTEYGIGIQNKQNESEPGLDDNESLLIDLKSEATSATFNLNVPNNESFKGGWIAFDANQNEIASGHANFASMGDTTITIKDIGDFQYIAFDAHTSKGGAKDSGFYVEPVSMLVNNAVVALGASTSVDYQVDIEAALTDRDGSESLSVTILGVPTDATLSDGVDNGDNTWTLSVPPGQLDYSSSLTLTVPEGTEDFSLRAVATATEGNGGDTATTEVNEVGDSFLHGSAEDDVFLIENDTHESSVTYIDNFDVVNDTLDLSEVIVDTDVTPDTLADYLNFALVDTDGDSIIDATQITVDSNGAEAGGEITDIYIQSNEEIDEISDLKIDYQND